MNNLQVFNSIEFGEVRIIENVGKILFCGNDIAKALGYIDTPKAIKQHCKDDGWVICPVIDNLGREQQAKFINEGNVYRLISHSKLPVAEKFERWVFDEVLPTIRQTGSYSMNPPDMEFIVRDTIKKSVGIVIKQLLPLVHTIIETSAAGAVQHIASKNHATPCEINSNQKSISIIDKLDIDKIIMIEAMLCSGELTFSDIVEIMEGNKVFITIADVYEYAKTIKVI